MSSTITVRPSGQACGAEVTGVDLSAPLGSLLLRRIYLLEQADADPSISEVGKRDAVVQLANNLHRLDPGDRRRLREELPFLETVVSRVPVARLSYRRRFEDLPAVHRAVRHDLAR